MSTNPVFTDGCSMTNTASQKYGVSASATYVAGKGRFGGTGLQLSGSGATVGVSFPNNPVTVLASLAIQVGALPSSGPLQIWHADDANTATIQSSLAWMPSGQLQFYRGNLATAVGSASTSTFPANSIIQLQIKCTVDPAAGLLECRLNGNATPILTFSGNTRTSANSYASRQSLGTIGSGQGSVWYSDIVLYDSGGTSPNDYIGNKRVYTDLPVGDSATGGLNQFSTSPAQGAGNHYKNINITPPPGDSNYNSTTTVGNRESHVLGALPAGASGIVGVNIWGNARIDDAGPHNFALSSRSNAVDSLSADINVAATYTYYSFFQATDPNTGAAWLAAAIPNSEIGYKLTS